MRTEIKALHQRLNTTSIYVTHDQVEAMTMADRIVLMRDGRVEQVGAPLDLYDRPANEFVAGFIGSPAMNFIPGVVRRSGNVFHVETGRGVALPLPATAAARDGQTVLYGVRPEHLTLAADGVPATVSVVEPTGSETLVFGAVDGAAICASFAERHSFKPGETISLSPRLDSVHLFERSSGQAIRPN
jgi:multiple sugar transport system ATP-binding protein